MSVTDVTMTTEEYNVSKGTYTGKRIYQVSVNASASAEAILTATDGADAIPSINDTWDGNDTGDDGLKCISKKVKRWQEDLYTFEVTVNYSSSSEEQEQAQKTTTSPLAEPTQYSYSDQMFQEPYFRDTDDVPIVNSAGEQYAQMPTRDASRGSITITHNVSSFNDATAEGYRNKINTASATINGHSYAARTLRVRSINATGPSERNGVTYWKETWVILKNLDTWDEVFEDRGLNQLDTNGEPKRILDADGIEVSKPYPLDGNGAAKALPTDAPATGTAKPYLATSFAGVP